MSKFIDPDMGCWVVKCDWVDTTTKLPCDKMFVDPSGGQNPNEHFQCGRHHGIVPQAERPEFQLPANHKLNEEVMHPGAEMSGTAVEEIDDNE